MDTHTQATVVNLNDEEYDVYIGRGSDWGNPYPVWEFKNREDCLKAYKWYLLNTRPDLLDRLDELKGKVLGCYCKPQSCHGDFLAELANNQSFLEESIKNSPRAMRELGHPV